MPECKAKFCTVKRGQGISTFPIPDPLKKKELCEQWIHKLGIENLNIKTFKFSKDSIVCANHFEDDCFKEDMQARLMGYTPIRRFLKEGAIPTIFKDSVPSKQREGSLKRSEKKQRTETLHELLIEQETTVNTDMPSCSADESVTKKRKLAKRPADKSSNKKQYVDIGVQVEPAVVSTEVSCNIQLEGSIPECPNCFARQHSQHILIDHMYTQPTNIICESKEQLASDQQNNVECSDVEIEPEDVTEFKTPTKDFHNDPAYNPSDDSDASPLLTPQGQRDKSFPPKNDVVQDKKFIVFSSCLNELYSMIACKICRNPIDVDDIRNRHDGTNLTVYMTCMNGHSFTWRSQPMIDQQPAGNILIPTALVLTGGIFAAFENFAKTLNLQFISRQTHHKVENDLIIPTIDSFWNQQRSIITNSLIGRNLEVAGDGRCDSPGFSAKYCTYTIMESKKSAILGFSLVQVTETNNSATRMELQGFKNTMQDVEDAGLSVATVATDRHVQIRKYMKEEYPNKSHQFDTWHMSKSVRKKLIAVAKKKGNEELMPWIKSISNHLWYCASQCNGDPELLVEMWTSITLHIQNIHQFEGKKFFHCGHPNLSNEDIRKKKWLTTESKAFKAMEKIVLDKRLLKDIRQLNLFCHTGELESYHSMMLKYVPKRLAFRYPQMVARTQLAALDHNFNLKRDQAIDQEGNPRYGVLFPKATGRWSVRKLYIEKSYDFRREMMTMTINRKLFGQSSETPHQKKAKTFPKNIAPVEAPSKYDLIESHSSRFKLL